MARTTFQGPVISQGGFAGTVGRAVAAVLQATGALDFPSIAAGAVSTLTIAVPGAAAQDAVFITTPDAFVATGLILTARVSGADVVTVQAYNPTGLAVDAVVVNVQATVLKTAAVPAAQP